MAAALPAAAAPKAAPSGVTIRRYRDVPVEMATGELVQREAADIVLKSRGLALDVTRNYRSQREGAGPFGYGWSWSHGERLEFPGDLVIHYVTADMTVPIYPDVSYTSAYARVCASAPGWEQGNKAVGAPDAIGGGYRNVAHYYGPIASLKPLVVGGWQFVPPPGPSTILQLDLTSIGATAYDADHPQYGMSLKLSAGGASSVAWGHRAYDFDYVTITADRPSWTWADLNAVQARLEFDTCRQNVPMDVFVDTFHLGVTYTRNETGEYKYLPGSNFQLIRTNGEYHILYTTGQRVVFDAGGRLLRKTDPSGNALRFDHDALGRVQHLSDGLGQSLTFRYDTPLAGARVTNVVDHLGRSVAYRYDGDDLVEFTDVQGTVTRYAYDSAQTGAELRHNLVRRTDPAGNAVSVAYHATNATPDRVARYRDGTVVAGVSNEVRYLYIKGTTYSYTPGQGSIQGVVYNASNDISHVFIREGDLTGETSDGVNLFAVHPAAAAGTPAATTTWQNVECALGEINGLCAWNPALLSNDVLCVSNWAFHVPGISNDIARVQLSILAQASNTVSLTACGITRTNWASTNMTWVTLDITADRPRWTWPDIAALTAKLALPLGATNAAAVAVDGFRLQIAYRQFDPGRAADDSFYAYDLAHNLVSVSCGGAAHQFAYDADGNMTSWTDPEGNTIRYEYDPVHGKPVRITDGRGHVSTQAYDARGLLTNATDAAGGATAFRYDAHGNLVETTDAVGNRETNLYDADGFRLLKTRNGRGNETAYDYDARGNCVRVTTPGGYRRHARYDAADRVVWRKDEAGAETTLQYDAAGRVTNTIIAAGTRDEASVLTRYDACGRPVEQVDALGNSRWTVYNGFGQPVLAGDRRGFETVFVYDERDRPWLTIDPASHVSESLYDARDNVVTNYDRRGYATVMAYNLNNQPVRIVDKDGNATEIAYDANGNRVRETFRMNGYPGCAEDESPEPLMIAYAYDAADRLTNKVVGVGRKDARMTSTAYDPAGRIVRETDALGNYKTLAYDANDNVSVECLHVRDGQCVGRVESVYDADDRLIMQIKGLGGLTVTNRHEVDGAGRKVADVDPLGNRTAYTYDGRGRLVATTDALGHVQRRAYDRAGNKILETSSLGLVTAFAWDEEGHLLREEIGYGRADARIHAYDYDERGNRVRETDPYGFVAGTAYDEEGNIVAETNKLGHVKRFAYDALGRLTNTTDEAGGSIAQGLDGRGKPCKLVDKQGGVTITRFDAYGRAVAITDPLGNTTLMAYDANDNKIRDEDPRGLVSAYDYDAAGRMTNKVVGVGLENRQVWRTAYDALSRPVRIVEPDGVPVEQEFDAAGNLVLKRDRRGLVTRWEYDALGRQTNAVNPAGVPAYTQYDAAGNVTATIDALGHRIRHGFDAYSLKTRTTDAAGGTARFSYDALGRLTNTVDALGNVESSEYDALGRVVRTTAKNGAVTRFEYDSVGRVTNTTDALGFATSKQYDAAGNVLASTDKRGNSMAYAYDALGRIVSIMDPASNAVTYAYDANGNKVRETSPSGLVVTSGYDAFGRLVVRTAGAGTPEARTTRYTHDVMGRVVVERDPLGGVVGYGYDANGNKTAVTNRRGFVTRYDYNALDCVTNVVDSLGNRASTEYDALGRIVRTTNRRGHATLNTYDAAGRLIGIRDPEGGIKSNRYDAAGRLIEEVAPNGLRTLLFRDALGQVTNTIVGAGLADSRSQSLDYDPLGRVIRTTDALGGYAVTEYDANGNAVAFSEYSAAGTLLRRKTSAYDALNQRVAETDARGNIWRTRYDSAGRKVATVDPLGNTNAVAYNIFDEVVAVTDAAGNTSVTCYDKCGREVEKINPLGQRVRSRYDAEGNRTAVIDDDGNAVLTRYDALNRPIEVNRSMPDVPLDVLLRADVNADGAVDGDDVAAIEEVLP